MVRKYTVTAAVMGVVLVLALLAGTFGPAVAQTIYGKPPKEGPTYNCGQRWDPLITRHAGFWIFFLKNCNWIEIGPGPGGRPGEHRRPWFNEPAP